MKQESCAFRRERFKRRDGSKRFHAEVRLRGAEFQRATSETRTKAKEWIQDTERDHDFNRRKNLRNIFWVAIAGLLVIGVLMLIRRRIQSIK